MRVSTELVASSSTRIDGSARNARAIVSSWRCPALTFAAVVVDHGVVAVGQRAHEVVDVRGLRRREDLLLGRVVGAVGDVLADRARRTATCPAARRRSCRAATSRSIAGDVDAVERDAARRRRRRSAARGWSASSCRHRSDRRSRRSGPGSATRSRCSISGSSARTRRRRGRTRRGRAADRGTGRPARSGRSSVLVEQGEDPLGRRHARLQQVDHRRDLRQRLGELARVLDERLHVARA